jgi:hypothetical protein
VEGGLRTEGVTIIQFFPAFNGACFMTHFQNECRMISLGFQNQ